MDSPYFSVIMANYNGGKFLAEAIQSVLDQEYKDFEFILVDDGSTDDSPAIIESFAQRHPETIRTLIKRENEGQGESFNKGFALSKGKFVCKRVFGFLAVVTLGDRYAPLSVQGAYSPSKQQWR